MTTLAVCNAVTGEVRQIILAPAVGPLSQLLAELTRDGRPSLAWATEWMPDGTLRRAWEACESGGAMTALIARGRVAVVWVPGRRPAITLRAMPNDDVVVTCDFDDGGAVLVDGALVQLNERRIAPWIREIASARDVADADPSCGARILRAAISGVPTLRIS